MTKSSLMWFKSKHGSGVPHPPIYIDGHLLQDLLVSIYHSSVITHKQYLTCTAVCANIYTCILVLMHSSCIQEHHKNYL